MVCLEDKSLWVEGRGDEKLKVSKGWQIKLAFCTTFDSLKISKSKSKGESKDECEDERQGESEDEREEKKKGTREESAREGKGRTRWYMWNPAPQNEGKSERDEFLPYIEPCQE